MLIRSQDKSMLINFKSYANIVREERFRAEPEKLCRDTIGFSDNHYQEPKGEVICYYYHIYIDGYKVGTFTEENKAYKVIEDIQELYLNNNNSVYEIPKKDYINRTSRQLEDEKDENY